MDLKTITVIGGSGFIGTRLVDRLVAKEGIRTVIIDKRISPDYPELSLPVDVRSIDDLRRCLPPDAVVVNLAAEHRDDVSPKSLYDEVNVEGARNVCRVASERGVSTIVFTSSVAVYGFAPVGTREDGRIAPFNDYGRTKYEAELVYRAWQAEAPDDRSLVIVRPTVVFGERNRGNVYNLFRQIASGAFVMVGDGENRKSMAYVENVAAFVEYSIGFGPGVHVFNFVDKPDFTMNSLVSLVSGLLGGRGKRRIKVPYLLGLSAATCFDVVASLTGRRFVISAVRVRKFCANSVYETGVDQTGFRSPVPLGAALERTVRYEFIDPKVDKGVFYTE